MSRELVNQTSNVECSERLSCDRDHKLVTTAGHIHVPFQAGRVGFCLPAVVLPVFAACCGD